MYLDRVDNEDNGLTLRTYCDLDNYSLHENLTWPCPIINSTNKYQFESDMFYNNNNTLIKHEDSVKNTCSSIEELVENWDTTKVMEWIIRTYTKEGIDYDNIKLHLLQNCPGTVLLTMPEEIFLQVDQENGRWLFKKVLELRNQSNYIISPYSIQPRYIKEENTQIPAINSKDNIQLPKCEVVKRQRGRPKSSNKVRRKPEHKTGRLWEFLRDLLLNPETCPELIRWEDHDKGSFRFVSSEKVAKIWGSKRGNEDMNYEKLSRAMRYYYKTKVLLPVLGKRLVYKFGPNAKNWRTSNPNFCLH